MQSHASNSCINAYFGCVVASPSDTVCFSTLLLVYRFRMGGF